MKSFIEPGRQFALPSLLMFGYFYFLWMVMAYIPLYLVDDLGLGHLEVSVLVSVFPLCSLLLLVPFGVASDKMPPKRMVTTGLAFLGAFLFGMRYATGFGELLLLFILGGIGAALFVISCSALYYKFLGEANRGRKLGFFSGIGVYGYGLGPLTGGVLLESYEMSTLFSVSLSILALFLLLSFLLKDIEPARFSLREYRADIGRRGVVVLALLTFILALHLGTEQTCFSLFLKHEVGLAEDSIGTMFLYIGLAVGTLSIINGFVNDSISGRGRSLRLPLYLGLLFSGLFNIAVFFVRSFSTVLMVRLSHVVGDSMFMVSQRTIIANLFLPERIGGNLGLMTTAHTLGIFVGALLSGAVPGYVLPFVVVGSLAVLAIPEALAARPGSW